jgi:hypothetical protein
VVNTSKPLSKVSPKRIVAKAMPMTQKNLVFSANSSGKALKESKSQQVDAQT